MKRGETDIITGCAGCLAPFLLTFFAVLGGAAAWALAHAWGWL